MKKFLASISNLIILVSAMFLLGLAIFILPKSQQKSVTISTDITSTSNPYPPPEVTMEMTPTNDHPFETPTATITPQPTVNPLTPVPPEGWPTDQPWPPATSTAEPIITPIVEPFPTPQISFLDENTSDDTLDSFWYPTRKGKNADLVLEELKIDGKGKRKEKPKTEIPLGFGVFAENPRLLAFQKTSDGAYVAYLPVEREGGLWEILDLSNGKKLSTRQKFGFTLGQFYRWSPDGKNFIAQIDSDGFSSATLVGVNNGEQIKLEVPDYEGITPQIDDMAFSPDGKLIAGSLSYHPYSGKNNPWMTEISIWSGKDMSSREMLCRVENGRDAEPHTLKWSPDGQRLLWVGGLETGGENSWAKWLWMADRNSGKCEPVAKMGLTSGQGLWVSGGFSADWSPDGQQIAFRIKDETDGGSVYRIVIMDANSKGLKDLFSPTKEILSNIQFSPSGDLIIYDINKGAYDEIWAFDIKGNQAVPIAGPTTLYSPFQWDK